MVIQEWYTPTCSSTIAQALSTAAMTNSLSDLSEYLSAQLSTLQVCGSVAPIERDAQANKNHPQAVRWVPIIMYMANLISLSRQREGGMEG